LLKGVVQVNSTPSKQNAAKKAPKKDDAAE